MTIKELVDKYKNDISHYKSANYNEMQLRSDFLDPLFELLGWDIKNKSKKKTGAREVILEESLKSRVWESAKKPDYTFRLYSDRKFFLEAKRPNVDIEKNTPCAKQLRRYGFTAKLNISVLSNFEYLIIYDCSVKVEEEDDFSKARVKLYHFTEYERKFLELSKYIGKESVYSGEFDDTWKEIGDQISRFSVDDLFLEQINKWRLLLGTEIYRYSPEISVELLNDYVQYYLNSIIFLRVCEDRELEAGESLLHISTEKNFNDLLKKFAAADVKYNAGLFQLPLSDKIIANCHSIFWQIIKHLYYPESPYSFSVFSSDILGNIYEIFLAEKLVIKDDFIILEKKSETIEKDIITTPTYVIREILKQTVIPRCHGKNDREILGLKIADIACGSGAFLLEAFQLLNDILVDYYLEADKTKLSPTGICSYKLPLSLKKELLIRCIYGMDKDYNAVEAAKFGLWLKLLEGESNPSLENQKNLLPDLSDNIFFGNSLVSPENIKHIENGQREKINPFDFKDKKFHIIIGNPPYMKSEDMKRLTPMEHSKVYKTVYRSAYKQYDKYFLFIERGLSLLEDQGLIGYIVPAKFSKVGAGKKLRHKLSKSGHLKRIISFGANQVFKSKTTYTCILILQKEKNEHCEYYEVKDLPHWKIEGQKKEEFELYPNLKLDDDVWVFVPPYLKHLHDRINNISVPLVNLLGKNNIFNGIQTSRNSLYVVTPYKEDEDYIYFENRGVEWRLEKELTRPYYQTPKGKSTDRLYTYRALEPNGRVIFPYKRNQDGVEIIREAELSTRFPFTYKYFCQFKPELLKRDVKPPLESDDWYKFGRGQSLDKWDSDVKIVIGVNSMGEKYALDYNRTFISSGGTAGYCGITVPDRIEYSIYYIQALLNSRYLEWFSSLFGEVFRGGYIARGTKTLNRLPIRTIDFKSSTDKQEHDGITHLQQQLIDVQSEIDKNSENNRLLIQLKRRFEELKLTLEQKLKELYDLGPDDNLIPLVKELYL